MIVTRKVQSNPHLIIFSCVYWQWAKISWKWTESCCSWLHCPQCQISAVMETSRERFLVRKNLTPNLLSKSSQSVVLHLLQQVSRLSTREVRLWCQNNIPCLVRNSLIQQCCKENTNFKKWWLYYCYTGMGEQGWQKKSCSEDLVSPVQQSDGHYWHSPMAGGRFQKVNCVLHWQPQQERNSPDCF